MDTSSPAILFVVAKNKIDGFGGQAEEIQRFCDDAKLFITDSLITEQCFYPDKVILYFETWQCVDFVKTALWHGGLLGAYHVPLCMLIGQTPQPAVDQQELDQLLKGMDPEDRPEVFFLDRTGDETKFKAWCARVMKAI